MARQYSIPTLKRRGRVISTLIFVVMIAGCTGFTDDHDHPGLKTGQQLFNHHCSHCHGEDGTGKLADQTPANILTHRARGGIVEYITTPVVDERSMPVFAQMPRAEAVLIARHLLLLQARYDSMRPEKKKPKELMISPR